MPWKVWKSPKDKKWYYHITANNGEILVPSEGYRYQSDALRGLRALQTIMVEDIMNELNRSTPKQRAQIVKDNQRKVDHLLAPNSGGTGTSTRRRKTT